MSHNGKSAKGKAGQIDPNNVSSLSIPKQTHYFLEKLGEASKQQGSRIFTLDELNKHAKAINLQVGDFRTFVDKLNAKSTLLMKQPKIYEYVG